MRLLLCAIAILGCSGSDCPTLAARYAAAFQDAQTCVPGQDSCNGSAPWVSVSRDADGGTSYSIDDCMNLCTSGNVNPNRAAHLTDALDAYRSQCQPSLAGCLCPREPDGGSPYTCRPVDGGGLCSP